MSHNVPHNSGMKITSHTKMPQMWKEFTATVMLTSKIYCLLVKTNWTC